MTRIGSYTHTPFIGPNCESCIRVVITLEGYGKDIDPVAELESRISPPQDGMKRVSKNFDVMVFEARAKVTIVDVQI